MKAFFLLFLILLTTNAEAYIDPGTGGMVVGTLSAIAAAALGLLSAGLLIFRKAIKRLYQNRVLFILFIMAVLSLFSAGVYILFYS